MLAACIYCFLGMQSLRLMDSWSCGQCHCAETCRSSGFRVYKNMLYYVWPETAAGFPKGIGPLKKGGCYRVLVST
jgi:hypothetical protein